MFAEVLAPACISTDSPRFFSFIPAAPTKAALAVRHGGRGVVDQHGVVAGGVGRGLRRERGAALARRPGRAPGRGRRLLRRRRLGRQPVGARGRARDRRGRAAAPGPPGGGSRSASRRTRPSRAPSGSWTARRSSCRPTPPTGSPAPRCARCSRRIRIPTRSARSSATAGTTNAGIVDDLAGLADVAARARRVVPRRRRLRRRRALRTQRPSPVRRHRAGRLLGRSTRTSGCSRRSTACALLYRDPALARAVHAQHASYLDAIRTADEWNPADYAYHLTRRARGLPFWFSLAVHGTDAYARRDRRTCWRSPRPRPIASARHRTWSWSASPSCRWCCCAGSAGPPTTTAAWSLRLLDEQIAFCLPTRWHDEVVARAVFLHPNTTVEMFDEVLDSMR